MSLIIICFPLLIAQPESHLILQHYLITFSLFDNKIKSGIVVSDINDHYPVFQITSLVSIKSRSCRTICNRSFNKCNMRTFVNLVGLADWNSVLMKTLLNKHNHYSWTSLLLFRINVSLTAVLVRNVCQIAFLINLGSLLLFLPPFAVRTNFILSSNLTQQTLIGYFLLITEIN